MPDELASGTLDENLSQQFYRHDPLLVLVRDRLQLHVGWCMLGIAVLTSAVLLGGAKLAGVSMEGNDLLIPVLEAWLVLPTGVAIYLLLPDALAHLFNTLRKNGVVGESHHARYNSYAVFEQELIAKVDSPWWVAIAVLGVSLYWLYRLLAPVPGDTTVHENALVQLAWRLAILIVYTPVMYGALVSIPRFLAGLVYTRRLFQSFEIRVDPLHPDGSAGMSAIGQMLTLGILVATAIGAAALAMTLSGENAWSRPEPWALVAIYLISLPSLFLGWLWMPHRAMVAARNRALAPLASEFLRSLPAAIPSEQEDVIAIKANTDRLAEIKRQYELIIATFPTWPMRTAALNRLVVTSILPLISSLLVSLISIIVKSVVAQ